MNESKLNQFMEIYEKNLIKAVLKYPKNYGWPVENATIVANKMRAAIIAHTLNKEGFSFRWTCKELNIPYIYEAIYKFLEI